MLFFPYALIFSINHNQVNIRKFIIVNCTINRIKYISVHYKQKNYKISKITIKHEVIYQKFKFDIYSKIYFWFS